MIKLYLIFEFDIFISKLVSQQATAGTPTAQRLPSGQIISVQQGAQSQPGVRPTTPGPVNIVRTQPGVVRATLPQNVPPARTTAASSTSGQPAGAAQGEVL